MPGAAPGPAGRDVAPVRPTHTALIVAVPEAEPAVGALRARLDAAASWGVPAHITVLYPFLPPADVGDDVVAAVAREVARVPRFAFTLTRTAWFGDTVLWLAPEPDGPLRPLTTAVAARFPQAPPYGGQFADVVPHLTVGDRQPRPVLDAAAAQVAPHLPIRADAETVRLIAGRPEPGGGWHSIADLPLGPADG